MNRINQHSGLLLIARMLERAAFYGMRSILLIYIIQVLNIPESATHELYSWLMMGIIVAELPGAIMGDLWIGNKNAMGIGALLLGVGMVLICAQPIELFYVGLVIFCLGSGLFSPNFIATYGKLHLGNKQQMDPAFALLYVLINVGAFAGSVFLTTIVDEFNYIFAFAFCGILFLGVAVLSRFVRQQEISSMKIEQKDYSANVKVLVALILVSATFWMVYDFGSTGMYALQSVIMQETVGAFSFVQAFLPLMVCVLGVIAMAVWMSKHYGSWIKLATGMIAGAMGFAIIAFSGNPGMDFNLQIYLAGLFFLAVAEVNIGPIVYSIAAKKANPKYMAMIMAVLFLPQRIFTYFFPIYKITTQGNEIAELMTSAGILAVIGIIIAVFLSIKKNRVNNSGIEEIGF